MNEHAKTGRREGAVLASVVLLILGAVLGGLASLLFQDQMDVLVASIAATAIVLAAVLALVALGFARRQMSETEALRSKSPESACKSVSRLISRLNDSRRARESISADFITQSSN
jgi:protein-S-isoprenylcysteine O-methyltransferase Ste14